jgi:hypothetical protein
MGEVPLGPVPAGAVLLQGYGMNDSERIYSIGTRNSEN